MIEEIRARHATTLGAAKELGRGLMHGYKPELKLGYSWENAALAVVRLLDLDALELKCYLLGFGCGMQDVEVSTESRDKLAAAGKSERFSAALTAGFYEGQETDVMQVYPAVIEGAATKVERKRVEAETMETCGCGAASERECSAAVEGYFTSLGQRSEEELRSLAEGDGCEAAVIVLARRRRHAEDE